MRQFLVACLTLLTISANAQTLTATNPAGQTIVEVITSNAGGGPTTNTIQTLPLGPATTTSPTITSPTTTSPTSTSTTTAGAITVTQPPVQQGPVGQPAASYGTAGGITPYTYTTVINGVTTLISDYFTPSFHPTVQPTVGPSGTILNYSSWLSVYGATSTTSASAGYRTRMLDTGWWWGLLTCLFGGVGGAWLVMRM